MAGTNMTNDSGTFVADATVPAIGGAEGRKELSPYAQTVQVVASAHLTDGPRAEGVSYNENPGVDLDTGAYPAGTKFSDSTPGESIN